MYKVIRAFTDAQDKGHAYKIGDAFPRNGFKATDERIKALSKAEKGKLNKTGRAYLKFEQDAKNASDQTLTPGA